MEWDATWVESGKRHFEKRMKIDRTFPFSQQLVNLYASRRKVDSIQNSRLRNSFVGQFIMSGALSSTFFIVPLVGRVEIESKVYQINRRIFDVPGQRSHLPDQERFLHHSGQITAVPHCAKIKLRVESKIQKMAGEIMCKTMTYSTFVSLETTPSSTSWWQLQS